MVLFNNGDKKIKETNLSAPLEMKDVELRKFGEPFKMGIPSEARKGTCRD